MERDRMKYIIYRVPLGDDDSESILRDIRLDHGRESGIEVMENGDYDEDYLKLFEDYLYYRISMKLMILFE
jgi:hypothetical protein